MTIQNITNQSTQLQVSTLKNQINKLKEKKKNEIIKKYEMKKKDFKNQIKFNNITFILFLLCGIFGGTSKLAGKNNGKNAFDIFCIGLASFGLLLNLFYKKDLNKIDNDLQKELNEVV